MLRNKSNAAFGLIVAAIAAWLFYVTTGFDGESDDRLFPQIILAILIALGVALILAEVKIFKANACRKIVSGAKRPSTRNVLAFSVAIAYPLAAFLVGFFFTTLIFLLIVPWTFTRNVADDGTLVNRPQFANAAYALLVSLFLYLSFAVLLKFSLPSGFLI
jgi:hypothetical protein